MLCYVKSLQSCPTLCDPRDGSTPGSPVPGILQARTLEWVAIAFSNAGNNTIPNLEVGKQDTHIIINFIITILIIVTFYCQLATVLSALYIVMKTFVFW